MARQSPTRAGSAGSPRTDRGARLRAQRQERVQHPAWDRPEIERLDTPEALETWADAMVRVLAGPTRPSAIGVGVLLSADAGLPRVYRDDPRRVGISLVALAVPGRPVALVNAEAIADLAPLQRLLTAEAAPYAVFHNAHLGLAALARRGVQPARTGSTRIAATLLAEGADGRRSDRRLDTLVGETLARALPGRFEDCLAEAELGSSLDEVVACATDVLVPLMRALTPRLRELGLSRIYALECRLLPVVIAMEAAGVGVDQAGFQQIVDSWARERRALLSGAEEPEGDPSAAARDEDEVETARAARLARLDKLLSTYGDWPRDHVELDGRIRYRLDPIATDTGRFACSQPNLQQVPGKYTAPGLRACFRPPPGFAFVIADYAQIELRVAAYIAGCPALTRVFQQRRDPHRATAANLARKREEDISAHERKLAKAVNFGFLFGMGATRFRSYARSSYGLELSREQAQRARDAFFATYPGIAAWHRRVGALERRAANEDVIVRTSLGRRRRFAAGRFSFNAALNIPVQGTAAEGFKLAMIELEPVLAALGGRAVLCVHDESIVEVPEARAEEARARVREAMEQAMARVVPTVPIVVEARVARHWEDG